MGGVGTGQESVKLAHGLAHYLNLMSSYVPHTVGQAEVFFLQVFRGTRDHCNNTHRSSTALAHMILNLIRASRALFSHLYIFVSRFKSFKRYSSTTLFRTTTVERVGYYIALVVDHSAHDCTTSVFNACSTSSYSSPR